MINIITDPRVFNNMIIILYGLSFIRFAYEFRWLEAVYMLSAMILTLTVTIMIGR